MHTLHHKLLHDLARHRAQFLAIALVIGIGIAGQVASGGLLVSLASAREDFYSSQRFADVFVSLERAPAPVARRIAVLPGVRAVEPRIATRAVIADPRLAEPGSAQLLSWPGAGLNGVALQSGTYPHRGAPEVVVSTAFAEAWGLHPGTRLRLIAHGHNLDALVVGTGDSPEFVYSIAPGDLLPDYRRHAVVWMDAGELAGIVGMEGAFNDLAVALAPGASEAAVISAMDRVLAPYGGGGAYGRAEQLSDRFIENEFDELEVHATVVPFVFLGAAAFLLHLVLTRRVRREREIIGMLKAFGYGNGAIALHYLTVGLAVFAVGAAMGIALGLWLGQLLAGLYVDFFRFPGFGFTIDPARTAVGLAVAGAAVASGTLVGLADAVRLPPAEAMRPPSPPAYGRGLRLPPALRRHFGVPERMIVRHLARGPVRTALTVTGLALACGLVAFSGFQRDAIDYMTWFHFELQDRADLTVTFVEPVPGRSIQDLARRRGVLAAEPFRHVAARLRHGHASYRTAVEAWPADARLRRLAGRDREPVTLPPAGLLVSAQLGRMLGAGAGDLVEVEVLEGRRQRLTVPVAGLLDDYVGVGAYMEIGALHRLLGEQDAVSGAWLAALPGRQHALLEEMSLLPRVAAVSRNDARVEAFQETFGKSLLIVAFVFLAIAATLAFAMVFNAARTVFDERRRELATMRVLGMTRAETAYVLLAELAVLALLAVPLGLALGYGLAAVLAAAMQSELFRLPVILDAASYARAVLLLLAATAVSMGWSAWDLARLDVKEALAARD